MTDVYLWKRGRLAPNSVFLILLCSPDEGRIVFYISILLVNLQEIGLVCNSTTTIMVYGHNRQRCDTIVGYRTTRWIVPQPDLINQ